MGTLKATLDKLSNKTSIIGNELTSLDERLCETNNILTDISIKLDRNPKEINPEQQPNLATLIETKRLKILRKQNEEMREVLNECYTKACEIVGMVGITNNLSNVLDQYNAKEGRWKKSLSLAKDIENVIPSKYLPFGENKENHA